MELLDSNALIYLSKSIIALDDLLMDNENYSISVITYMEVLGFNFDSKEEENFTQSLLEHFEIIYIDYLVAQGAIELRKKYKIKLPDAIICSSAILNGATLVTNDLRLRAIKEMKLRLLNINSENDI